MVFEYLTNLSKLAHLDKPHCKAPCVKCKKGRVHYMHIKCAKTADKEYYKVQQTAAIVIVASTVLKLLEKKINGNKH